MIALPSQSGLSPASEGLSLCQPKSIDAVEAGRQAVLAYLAPFDLSGVAINRIEVILEELVSNVVRHSVEARSIMIEARCNDRAVAICVEDDGAPFNPLERAAPAPFSKLEDAPLGGLGIPLIKQLSQGVSYQRIGSRNRISVTVAAE